METLHQAGPQICQKRAQFPNGLGEIIYKQISVEQGCPEHNIITSLVIQNFQEGYHQKINHSRILLLPYHSSKCYLQKQQTKSFSRSLDIPLQNKGPLKLLSNFYAYNTLLSMWLKTIIRFNMLYLQSSLHTSSNYLHKTLVMQVLLSPFDR